jgi:hypothetical protein
MRKLLLHNSDGFHYILLAETEKDLSGISLETTVFKHIFLIEPESSETKAI